MLLPDSPEWHLREEDYASLFEEYLTPDPVESFLNEIPIIHLEASNDRAACNMDYYPMDAALGTHEVFSNWNYDQFHNSSVEFTDTTTYPHPLPFEDQYETEILDVQVSFRVDANGVTIPMATAYVLVKSINGQPAMRLFKWGRAFQ